MRTVGWLVAAAAGALAGEQLSPRWRVIVAYEFIRKLWLLGGVDDILNSDRRDYFVGLQLRFTDNDLKSILPFASGALPK